MADITKETEQTKQQLEQLRTIKERIDLGKNLSLMSVYAVLVGILVSMSTTIIYQEFILQLDARIRLAVGLIILGLLIFQLYRFYREFHKKTVAEREIDTLVASLEYEQKEKERKVSTVQERDGQS